MKYAVYIPNFGPYGDVRALADVAREAEQAGWDGFFIWDHIAHAWPDAFADTTIALTAIAINTERIRFGPMITPLARRRPTKLARETASIDRLSGGRLTLGVGLGGTKQEFEFLGDETDAKTRAAMLDEGLEVLARCWQGEKFTHEGTHFTVKESEFRPTPAQQPRIPVWVAGQWPYKSPFRRAARWDGAFPLAVGQPFNKMMPPEEMKAAIDFMKAQRTSDAPFDVAHWGITRDAQDTLTVQPYAEVGVTWWMENVSPWVFNNWRLADGAWPVEAIRARIMAGPPRL